MTINCKGKLLDLSSPKVMGILNLTPDSFFDGGKHQNEDNILKTVKQMLEDGLDILDIGGQTTKPGSEVISADEELQRVEPVLDLILKNFPELIISLDTFYSKVAQHGVEMGAAIINDISVGRIDDELFKTVAELKVPYILMHMQGMPKDMQAEPHYDNIIQEVNLFFAEKIKTLKELHINDIILDPGYGFGKTLEHNFQLLRNQELLGFNDYPILAGVSRKSMICKTLGVNPKDALNGTTAVNMLALQHGAKILRVHDVKEAKECIKIFDSYQSVQIL
ncbi:dihydropteroate synthase [Weeksellaceae bacterium KMM 9713]|uniref:Dihydropteroate synthase n=1 Tax=Profundicola chukchiensis TaxID=2961959 RepID=A0A9X4N0A7_9FLAO|nr:dihydropteroate synthase [Profundicola chukchiensis]MDG4945911.1 dihydropteroate synthase [Profundicola chukchiensis]